MEHIISHFIKVRQASCHSHRLGNGHINQTFKVEISEDGKLKKYVLQKINYHVFRQPEVVMENIQAVAAHLSRQVYPLKILRPIRTLSGQLFHLDKGGGYWRMFPFFENTLTLEKVETADQAHRAAKAFGTFAKALGGMDISKLKTTIPHFHDGLFRLRFFEKILAEAEIEKKEKAKKEVDEILRSAPFFKKMAGLKIPRRAAHHDTKINNLLFNEKNGQPVAVIDLDTVMPGTVLSDFGDLVRTSVSPADEDEAELSKIIFRKEIYAALLEGFLLGADGILTEKEKENLPLAGPWLTLMQAMRFLTDHLAGDVYYPIKYGGHNLVRAKSQLQLFREMEKDLKIKSRW